MVCFIVHWPTIALPVLFLPCSRHRARHIILRGWSHFWTFFLNYWHRGFPFHLDIPQKIVIALISAPFKSSLVLCESGAETRNEAYIRISTKIKLTREPERAATSGVWWFGHPIGVYINPLNRILSAAIPRFGPNINRKFYTTRGRARKGAKFKRRNLAM